MINQHLIDRIEREYSPEFDVPLEPQVTWADACLLEIIKDQQAQIEQLEKQVEDISITLRRNLPA